jgi:hypothetical protein
MICPNCRKDTITYKLVVNSSVKDPLLCDSCRQQIFQYRFISEIGQIYSMLSFQLGILLLVVEEWLWGVLFFLFALGAFFGARYVEIYYTRLRVLGINEKRSKWIQFFMSFLAMVIGIAVFIPFLMLLPDDNEYINFVKRFISAVSAR